MAIGSAMERGSLIVAYDDHGRTLSSRSGWSARSRPLCSQYGWF
jgi:hypothetical protein